LINRVSVSIKDVILYLKFMFMIPLLQAPICKVPAIARIWNVTHEQVLKARSPACDITGRWWNFYEVRTTGRKLGQCWDTIEEDIGTQVFSSFSLFASWLP
jgi:hypothetical protein